MPARMAPVEDIGTRFADALTAAVPGWVERSVVFVVEAWSGSVPDEVRAAARDAGVRAASEVGPELRRLLTADVDEQWTNPLTVVRGAVRYPTEVLAAAGVPGVVRDEFDETHFPDDEYGLTPVRFADVDPSLAELGYEWGATKAMAHKARHAG